MMDSPVLWVEAAPTDEHYVSWLRDFLLNQMFFGADR